MVAPPPGVDCDRRSASWLTPPLDADEGRQPLGLLAVALPAAGFRHPGQRQRGADLLRSTHSTSLPPRCRCP